MSRIHNEEKTVSFTNGARKTVYPHVNEKNWILISHYTQTMNLKCFKDFNVRPDSVKFLEDNIEKKVMTLVLAVIL